MSRIGKLPVAIPSGVSVSFKDGIVTVKGPKGELTVKVRPEISVELLEGTVSFVRSNDEKESRSLHGLTRTLVSNMIIGVSKGYEKKLQILGVGYSYIVKGSKIVLSLGFSHPVEFDIWPGITVVVDQKEKDIMLISGIDKQKVGEFAAQIRKMKKPEPYKGKGIRYVGEYVRRKVGKTAKK